MEHLERLLQIEKRAAGITTSSSKSAEAADVDPTASARAEWMLVPPDINNAPAGRY